MVCVEKKIDNIIKSINNKSNRNYEIYSIKFGIVVAFGNNR